MKRSVVSAKVILDNRVNRTNQRSIKLRLTFKTRRKYYSTGYNVTNEQWRMINSVEASGKLRTIKNDIAALEGKAQSVVRDMRGFTFQKFEYLFFEKAIKYKSLKSCFDNYIENLYKNDQIGTALAYTTAYHSFYSFKANLDFSDISVDLLYGYESWMLKNNKSITTIGIYARVLRAILNFAIDKGIITREQYPFGRRKYVIPTGRNIKKALDIHQIKQLFEFSTEPFSFQDRSKDFWILSYLCNGMNMMDIAKLKWNNLDKTTITFIREKTRNSRRDNPIKIVIIRNDHINKIIDKWRKKDNDEASDYVFDIINKSDNPLTAKNKVKQFTHVTNDWMKRIGEELAFDLTLTTYVARHSFATIVVRSGAPLEFASQSLGHASIVTTQKYFAGFDLRAQEEYAKALVNF